MLAAPASLALKDDIEKRAFFTFRPSGVRYEACCILEQLSQGDTGSQDELVRYRMMQKIQESERMLALQHSASHPTVHLRTVSLSRGQAIRNRLVTPRQRKVVFPAPRHFPHSWGPC